MFSGCATVSELKAGSLCCMLLRTPVVADAASGGNEGTSASATGRYYRHGSLVRVTMQMSNIDTTGMTAGNDVYFTGLPYSVASIAAVTLRWVGAVGLGDVTFTGNVSAVIDDNVDAIRLLESASGAAADFIIVSELSSGNADVFIDIEYETDD